MTPEHLFSLFWLSLIWFKEERFLPLDDLEGGKQAKGLGKW